MEPTNLHDLHHPLQGQHSPVETATSLSSYGAVGSSHSWTPINIALNADSLNQNLQESGPRSRAQTQGNDMLVPCLNSSMTQHLGYQWGSNIGDSCLVNSSQSNHDIDLPFSKTKEEISDTFPAKFTEMINSPSSMERHGAAAATTSYIKNKQKDLNALSEKLVLKTLFSGADSYSASYGMGVGVPSRGNFSQIYPIINISNQSSSAAISSSLGIDMQSSDLVNSPRFNVGLMSLRSQDGLGLGLGRFTDSLSFRIDHMQQRYPIGRSSCNSINPSHFINGTAETKSNNISTESKVSQSQAAASKKSRLESGASCPPFKVRKEKLGERIAALQQLVAPFGKTDTASVLMEAIGYIKFLQNQVETLISVPYMRSSRNQTTRVMQMQGGSGIENSKEEAKQDLRSRGLCLVPLSCMSYLTGDGGSGVWKHPDFAGAT